MRAVLQRCTHGSVTIDGKIVGEIQQGFVLLLGIQTGDTEKECDYLLDKVLRLRVFEDEAGKLNRSFAGYRRRTARCFPIYVIRRLQKRQTAFLSCCSAPRRGDSAL